MLQNLSKFAVFLAETGEGTEEIPVGSMLPSILMMVALVAVMYFVMIRPESKRKKTAAKMRNELIVGDEVTTVAGIVGRVVNIKDDTVTIETGSDKTRLTFVKGAISSKTEMISS